MSLGEFCCNQHIFILPIIINEIDPSHKELAFSLRNFVLLNVFL